MGDDGTGHGDGSGRMSDGVRHDRQAGAVTRRASVGHYLIGVRPVLINVFADDLVEILVANRAGRAVGGPCGRAPRLENRCANSAAQC
ncbi:hypothetical protein CUJ89_25940 [Burkholderia pyrrocinia]|uniref:Uncharacterized protein n=1 Tax=Burkholderia pyrrocinia TaxID=60550 RepID=A0A2Z5N2K0_BURPY|nr:hypothetical protein CUJ89_25940 [Burkholderia pyrrocinia]